MAIRRYKPTSPGRRFMSVSAFDEPSTKQALELLEGWGQSLPVLVVVTEDEDVAAKSFRNLDRVAVLAPSELEVGAVVWARSLLVSEAALPLVQARAGVKQEESA